MKRFSSRKFRLGYTIKLYKKSKLIQSATFGLKSRLVVAVGSLPWEKAYLKVKYNKDFFNDGWYETKKDLKSALNAFTEKSVLDYLE